MHILKIALIALAVVLVIAVGAGWPKWQIFVGFNMQFKR